MSSLEKTLDGALFSLKSTPGEPAKKKHKFLVGLSGALGGSFGITALAIELPVFATIMLRSIADIARSEGEYLENMDTKMACLTVFALSGGGAGSESADTSYYVARSFKRYRQSCCRAWFVKLTVCPASSTVLIRSFLNNAMKRCFI